MSSHFFDHRMWLRIAAAFFLSIGVLPHALFATGTTAPSSAPADDALDRELRAVNDKTRQIKSLKADFIQEKKSPLLRKPLVSQGTVLARGGKSLWVTTGAQPMSISASEAGVRMYFPDRKVIEEYPMQSQFGMLAAMPMPGLDAIRESFIISRDDGADLAAVDPPARSIAIRLIPNRPEMARYIDHIRVLLDSDRGVVAAFEVTDPDGEITRVNFSKMQTDVQLPDTALNLSVPADVKTVRPLGEQPQRP